MSNNDDNKYNDDYHTANEALIKRESMKHERAKVKAESLEANMAKGLANALRQARQKLAKDAHNAVSRSESGTLSENERKIVEAAQKGIDNVRIDEGIITGFDLPDHLRFRHADDDE